MLLLVKASGSRKPSIRAIHYILTLLYTILSSGMKYRKLGFTDINSSILGFGGSVFNNFFKDSYFESNAENILKIKLIIKTAIDLGVNYFDVAPWYGDAQFRLAIGLEEIPRNSYYLATKVGRYNCDKPATEWFDFSYQKTIESVDRSLEIFKTSYIDLIQVHDFEFANDLSQIVNETLPALAQLQKQGKVRYIGINSYSIEKLKELLELSKVKIDTILTYTHLTLDDTSLLDHIDYFRSKGVGIIHASPLAMGLYTKVGPPRWHNAPNHIKNTVKDAFSYCKERNVNLTKLAIHFSVTNEFIDTNIVSMANEDFIKENISYLDDLSEHEKAVLQEVREKFFIPLNYRGWGNIEVVGYHEKVNKNN